MRIVYIDSYTANPGDLSWDQFKKLGEFADYNRTPPEQVVERLRAADAVLTNKVMFDAKTIAALPKLKYIGVTATGYNIVDVEAAKKRGVTVTNVPAYSTPDVAQAVFALLLELTNHTSHYDRAVHEGRWSASPDFCYWDLPLTALSGLTMGIAGFGNIGQAVAVLAQAFGMKVLVHTRTPRADAKGVELCGLDDLFSRADVVSLHCPLTPETEGFVNAERLARMKSSAYLVNTSRGKLVDEQALAAALNEGRLAGAGLDVLSTEPPKRDNPLLKARNCVIMPHIGWASVAARKRLLDVACANLKAFIAGQPLNVVNS